MARGPLVTLEERLEMWRRLRSGESIGQVADALGRSRKPVDEVSAVWVVVWHSAGTARIGC